MPTDTRDADDLAAEAAGYLDTEWLDACPLCGSNATRTWRTGCRDWQQPHISNRFEYKRCIGCSARFLADRPLESELGKVYFAGYRPHRAAAGTFPRPLHDRRILHAAAAPLRALGSAIALPTSRRLARLHEWAYTPESVGEMLVDYGCGSPMFLDEARERGFSTIGVDSSTAVLESVREAGHAAYLGGSDFERNVGRGTVGCVRMNHVIEHLYDPREAVAAIRAKLRPGGRIHVSTHDPESIGSRLFGRRWHALDCPRHVVLFRPPVLCTMLIRLGFRDVSVVREAGPKDLTRSWGIVLYDRGRITHDEIGAMATDTVRSGIFWPLAGAAALLSAADRYHVFARA